MEMFIYPYKQGSKSAIALSQMLKAKLIRRENSKFRPSDKKLVINWGASDLPESIENKCQVLNHAKNIAIASNKLSFFKTVAATNEEVRARVPEWTVSKETAAGWLQEERPPLLFARTLLTSHSGEGIIKVKDLEGLAEIKEGTLIVKYVPKRSEFRVHIYKNEVFCLQKKVKQAGTAEENTDFQIRNHASGFVFARHNIEAPEDVFTQAKRALAATGLDFGAVDVIYNERQGNAYVLEVNTAPGLEGSTVEDYVKIFGGKVEAPAQ